MRYSEDPHCDATASRVVGGRAHPYEIVRTSNACSRYQQLAGIDSHHLLELETTAVLCLNRGLIISRTAAWISYHIWLQMCFIVADEDSHDAVSVIGSDSSTFRSNQARGAGRERLVHLGRELRLLRIHHVRRSVDVGVQNRCIQLHPVVGQVQIRCVRNTPSVATTTHRERPSQLLFSDHPKAHGTLHYSLFR